MTQNDPKRSSAVLSEIRDTTSRGKDIESKSLSEVKITPVKPLSNTQDYNIPSNEDKGVNQPNFITLGRIPEQERIEIIQTRSLRRMNVVNRISTSSGRQNIFEEVL